MTDQEAAEILIEIRKLRMLIVGNGDQDAVLPRLQALEYLAKALKLLLPIITALIVTGLALTIFGK
jgi:hypothetical protein